MVAMESLVLIQAHGAQSRAYGSTSRSEDSACYEHLNVLEWKTPFEKSGAKGSKSRIIVTGRVRILRSPLLAEIGDERVPYPFLSRMAKVDQEEVPREYRPLIAERDGKPDELQEMFGKK